MICRLSVELDLLFRFTSHMHEVYDVLMAATYGVFNAITLDRLLM